MQDHKNIVTEEEVFALLGRRDIELHALQKRLAALALENEALRARVAELEKPA